VDLSSSAAIAESSESATSPLVPLDQSLVAASQPFVGQWNRLVSTTNWQKGRIIVAWREALVGQGVAVTEYSDEAWSRLVGGITGQHVGRLRRVSQRFGETFEQFAGLYWSHFQAALDWSDAEMWLEGAVQNGWSVALMRNQRWETLGQVEAERPQAADVVANETDEDFEPGRTAQVGNTAEPVPHTITGEYSDVQAGPRLDGPDFGDEATGSRKSSGGEDDVDGPAATVAELVRPFENLPELPDDLAEAFDTMKLAILRHKTSGWEAIAAADVLRSLDALKALVTAPSSESAPF
jgi:hypothetical protein